MSITNTKAKSVYNANGTTIEWNLGFTYDDTVSNVHIYIVDANDNETEVTSNYSIADGVLTYPTTASGLEPLAEGNKLVIVRDTPRTQDIELTSNGKLDGKVLEGGYDKLTLQVQELTEQVNRAVKIPVTEESADNFLDPITAITEAKKEALVEIAQATTPAENAKDTAVAKAQVATEQATIATNAATSAKAAQVGAEQAEQNATAQAEKAEKAVTAFVEGLGTAKNAVIDLGTFDGKTSVTSSRTIEFDQKPIAVSLRFSDTNKKLWINGTNSTVGIEVIDNTHCNLFYSIASADFVGQNAVKGPFVVQAIIQYSLLDNSATETEMGAVQLATKAEAEAGTNDTKAMTPLKTKYAIEANATVQTLRNDIDDLGDQVAGIEAKIPADASDTNQLADKQFVQDLTSALNFVQWVDSLPETGESKYIYAVPREETDTDGKQIAALYLWDGSAWRGAGAFSLNIDPDTLATKTELAGYLPLASKAVANGVASLDANAKVPSAQIPTATASALGGVKPDGNTITVTEDGVISATGGSSSGRSIGEVYFSQSSLATDNSGALPLFTGETIASANTIYPDFYAWVKSHPELCKTKAEYDELVNTAQGCLFYVADEVEGSLRLPKYKLGGRVLVDSKQPTATSPSWYNLYSDGWLEQGGYFGNPSTVGTTAITETFWKSYITPPTVLFGNMSHRKQAAYDSEHYPYDVTANGFTHENVQPQGQGTRWYAFGYAANTPMENIMYPWIVSFTAAVPASTAQAAEFTGALSGKANTDLSNVSSATKAALLDLLAMDTSTWATLVTGTDFVAPSAGWLNYVPSDNSGTASIGVNTGWSNCRIIINGKTVINQCYCSGKNGTNADAFVLFVKKGQVVYPTFSVGTVYFYPCKGAK